MPRLIGRGLKVADEVNRRVSYRKRGRVVGGQLNVVVGGRK